MTGEDVREKLKKLEKALKEGRISEETYKELKEKYKAGLTALEENVRVEEAFSLPEHIKRLQMEELIVAATVQKEGPSAPRRWKRIKWDPKVYVRNIADAILYGGFSYFRYVGEAQQREVEIGVFLKERKAVEVRERVPVLLEDEELKQVGAVKQILETGGWKAGTLYYTGRRFIFDVREFEVVTDYRDVVPTLTMASIWIKPDFSGLLSMLGLSGFLEEGTVRKNLYDRMAYEITGIKKKFMVGEFVASTWVLTGPNSRKTMGEGRWVPAEEGLTLEQLYEKLRSMTERAKETRVEDLIAHAYACHRAGDVWIATSLTMGPRKMSELPYAYWSVTPILV